MKKSVLFILLSFVLSFSAYANHGCASVYTDFSDKVFNKFYNQKAIKESSDDLANGVKEIHLNAKLKETLSKDESYNNMMKNSVEIIYQDIEPFGHINLRVGENIYSFNYIASTSQNSFNPSRVGGGNIGFVFRSNEKTIKAMEQKIKTFYDNSRKYNVPPFDAYSGNLEIVESSGRLKYKSSAPEHGNNSFIGEDVKLVDNKDGAFLVTPNGEKYAVNKVGDTYYTPSFSCSSSATCIMDKFLGMEIKSDLGRGGAKYLKSVIENRLKVDFNELETIMKY